MFYLYKRDLEVSEDRGDQLINAVLCLQEDFSSEQKKNKNLLSEIQQLNVRMEGLQKAELENNKLNQYLKRITFEL